jgi:hypothetical protein
MFFDYYSEVLEQADVCAEVNATAGDKALLHPGKCSTDFKSGRIFASESFFRATTQPHSLLPSLAFCPSNFDAPPSDPPAMRKHADKKKRGDKIDGV